MNDNNEGMLVVFSGPSGAGKGTVLEEFFKHSSGTVCNISATTRKPRPGEIDGIHYHFVTKEYFEEMIQAGEVVEYNFYNGNYYGSPSQPIREILANGTNVILANEVNGARQVKEKFPNAISIFVLPPSFAELKRRLVGRNTETADQIAERMETAKNEIRMAHDYDYIVINDNVADAAVRLDHILKAARYSAKQNKTIIDEVLNNA